MIFMGFSGRARSGKTSACEAIRSYALRNSISVAIYDIGSMIRLHCIASGLLPENLDRKDMTREHLDVLVAMGNKMRAHDENFWIKQMLAAVERDRPEIALCPNVRFATEALTIRQAGGVIVRCTRYNADGSLYISEDRNPNDVTETSLEFWPPDYYLAMKTGQAGLMDLQAVALCKFIKR